MTVAPDLGFDLVTGHGNKESSVFYCVLRGLKMRFCHVAATLTVPCILSLNRQKSLWRRGRRALQAPEALSGGSVSSTQVLTVGGRSSVTLWRSSKEQGGVNCPVQTVAEMKRSHLGP